MEPLFDIDELLPELNAGVTIITANNRIASKVIQAYSLRFGPVLKSPNVVSFSVWIKALWNEALEKGMKWAKPLVTESQRKHLMQLAIKESPSEDVLMGLTMLSSHAERAYKSLKSSMIGVEDVPVGDINSEMFNVWYKNYEGYLKVFGLEDEVNSLRILADNYDWCEGKSCLLVGFEDIGKSALYLLNKAFSEGVMTHKRVYTKNSIVRVEASDQENEISVACNWAREVLSIEPDARIALVHPELGSKRSVIERIISRTFEPNNLDPICERYVMPFNFSAGVPLGECPIVYDALELLMIGYEEWETSRLRNILMSPFWGVEDEGICSRVLFEQELLKLQRHSITAGGLLRLLQKCSLKEGAELDDLSVYLLKIVGQRSVEYVVHMASEWAEIFVSNLTELSWGGKRTQDSIEYQQVEHFYTVLETFSELDSIGVSFTRRQAIGHLKQLLNGTPFQAKTLDSPIQVMGILEASSLKFDYVWVMGLISNVWPQSTDANPLLPLYFQVENDMPRSSPERELSLAKELVEKYRGSGRKEVIFSSHKMDGEGNEVACSQLISEFPLEKKGEAISSVLSLSRKIKEEIKTEVVVDENGPALSIDKCKGGASVLKDQGLCPFNAFAKYRLGANEIPEPVSGVPASFRGTLIHDVLGKFWSENRKSLELCDWDENLLGAKVDEITRQVLAKRSVYLSELVGKGYLGIELRRVNKIVCAEILHELKREHFEVVSVEEEYECDFSGLRLKLRLDRKDKIERSGEYVVVDFKTGKSVEQRHWFGERSEQPQLPLYAITDSSNPSGIMFAQCNSHAISLKGIGNQEVAGYGIIDISNPDGKAVWARSLPRDWEEQKGIWKQNLGNIANEFKNGYAAVSFPNEDAIKNSQAYLPLNRLREVE